MEQLTLLSPFIAVAATIIAILASVIFFVKCSCLSDKIDELNERIDKRKADANLMDLRFRREIEALKTQLHSLSPQDNQAHRASEEKNADSNEAAYATVKSEFLPVTDKTKDAEHTLYASSYDSERNQFFAIESSPSQKTIYEITYFESNPQTGYFTIYKEAEHKVVECRDHLDAASEIEGRGKKIDWSTLNPGKLSKKENNWEVVTPLTVKFV
ncbi:MAG: hypothetical protein PUA96_09625 [Bacteroidales bacterium]|nr:hypothetical protein [Bacteroidales bacterium]